MEQITALQICNRFSKPLAGGVVDLRDLDFRGVNMQDEKVKDWFRKASILFIDNLANPPLSVDMTGSEISGVDLRGYDFSNVAMNRVKACGTIFIKCLMSDTHLGQADLENADFRFANLHHTKFYEANITGVNFSGAIMLHTHGLGLKNTDKIIERLGSVSSIRDAIIPPEAEKFLPQIQAAISARSEKIPEYKATLLEYEEEETKNFTKEPKNSENQGGNPALFTTEWLRQVLRESKARAEEKKKKLYSDADTLV